jgi:hypothetical protein
MTAQAEWRRRNQEVGPMGKRSTLARIGAVAAGPLLAIGLVSVPSGAATANTKTPKSYLATYNATTSVSSISVTVTLPSYTCKKSDDVAAYADTEDLNTDTWSGTYVGLACGKKNVPIYSPALEIDGAYTNPAATMRADDTVVLSTSCGATGTVVTIDDVTSTSSVSTSSASPSDCSAAFVGDIGVQKGAGPKVDNLPRFGSIDFSNVNVNGSSLGSFTPTVSNYYEGKKNIITVGPITDGGTAFVTTQGA